MSSVCSTVACLGVSYVVIMKRMKQVTLFGFLVLEFTLSELFICISSLYLCLQEWFIQVNHRVLRGGGWLATQFTPPWISPDIKLMKQQL